MDASSAIAANWRLCGRMLGAVQILAVCMYLAGWFAGPIESTLDVVLDDVQMFVLPPALAALGVCGLVAVHRAGADTWRPVDKGLVGVFLLGIGLGGAGFVLLLILSLSTWLMGSM